MELFRLVAVEGPPEPRVRILLIFYFSPEAQIFFRKVARHLVHIYNCGPDPWARHRSDIFLAIYRHLLQVA